MAVEIQVRRGAASVWTSVNPTLAQGEWGLETDTDNLKIGNGTSAWTSLPYQVYPYASVVNLISAASVATEAYAFNITQAASVSLAASIAAGGGGSGSVSSVFGRTGAVTAQVGDYSAYYDANGKASAASTAAIAASDPAGLAASVKALSLLSANNLADVADAGTSRQDIHIPALTSVAAVQTASVATFTGLPVVDGYQTANGDAILVTSAGVNNGPWLMPASGSVGSWTRPTEFATGASVHGRTVAVMNGTVGANQMWQLNTPTAGILVGTSSQSWSVNSPAIVGYVPQGTGSSVTTITIPTNPTATDTSQQPANDAFVWNAMAAASVAFAPLRSPALTGTPTAPTNGTATDVSTQLATDAFVWSALLAATTTSEIVNFGSGTPASVVGQTGDGYIDYTTLNMWGPQSGSSWGASPIATLAPLASPAFTGVPTAPTAAASVNNTTVATTAYTTAVGASVKSLSLQSANDLSDLADAGTSRQNLHIPVLTSVAAVQTASVGSFTGLPLVDGYQTVNGDTILVTANGVNNGPWLVAAGSWTRPTEFATSASVHGRTVAVMNGTVGTNQTWQLNTPTAGILVGTSSQSWSLSGDSPTVFNVRAYGATGNGSTDDTISIQNTINAAASVGGIAYLPPGTYKTSSTLRCTSVPTTIQGAGLWATTINYYGTGDCLRVYSTTESNAYPTTAAGGGTFGVTIDGTHSTGISNGFHMGDIFQYRVDIGVQNFTASVSSASVSSGVLFDNQYYFTEQLTGRIYAQNCSDHVVFNVGGASTSTNSFARPDLNIYINSDVTNNQNGVVLQNGAFLYDGRIAIRGNWGNGQSSGPLSNAVLYLAGSTVPAGHPSAGSYVGIDACTLEIGVESASVGAYTPRTIYNGSAGNITFNATGIMDFSQGGLGTFTPCNCDLGTLGGFAGTISGDSTLSPASSVAIYNQPFVVGGGPVIYGYGVIGGVAPGDVLTGSGDFFKQTLTTNTTIVLGADYNSTLGAAQRITIVLVQAASGGPYTVTWPSTGSPSLASPTVNWSNGVAPVMSTAANAVDEYFLETFDGITWFGSAVQQQIALPGLLLARAQLAPSSASVMPVTISTTGLSAISSGHLKVAFTVPSSGNVLVRLQGFVNGGAAAGTSTVFGITSTSASPGTVVGVLGLANLTPTATIADNGELAVMEQVITGLGASTAETWYFAAMYSGTQSSIVAQGTTSQTTVPTGAPAIIAVWAA